jgi:hypothetical protein
VHCCLDDPVLHSCARCFMSMLLLERWLLSAPQVITLPMTHMLECPRHACRGSIMLSSSSSHGARSEVYVAARPFTEFGGDLMQRLSPEAKLLMVDAGVCHFMVIVKQPSQQMVQLDFGPIGGDVHVGGMPQTLQTASATASALNRTAAEALSGSQDRAASQKKRKSKAVPGEVRVKQVSHLSNRIPSAVPACLHACDQTCTGSLFAILLCTLLRLLHLQTIRIVR